MFVFGRAGNLQGDFRVQQPEKSTTLQQWASKDNNNKSPHNKFECKCQPDSQLIAGSLSNGLYQTHSSSHTHTEHTNILVDILRRQPSQGEWDRVRQINSAPF
jgi:hypothetical protein